MRFGLRVIFAFLKNHYNTSMKISLNWASHWTKVPAYDATSIEQFAHTYSTYTAEVEGVETHVFDDKIVV